MPPLLAGAGRARIVLPADLFPVDGFLAERDPLYARVVLLWRGTERLTLAVLDQTSIAAASLAGIRRILPGPALICASHTFSAPHVAGDSRPELQRALETAVAEAARQAVRELQPARIGWASGSADINVNRDVQTPDGWWLGANHAGPPFPATFVVTMANGAAKYLADAGSYQRITYAAMNSQYAAGAAEKVAARLVESLQRLRDQPA